MKPSKSLLGSAFVTAAMMFSAAAPQAAELLAQAEIAAAPPALLRVEVTGACMESGAVFKVTNRGGKWPRTGMLKLYYADDNTLIGQRRLRLVGDQRVSFAVKDTVMSGRPVAVWVEPEWYRRDFKFDASMNCT